MKRIPEPGEVHTVVGAFLLTDESPCRVLLIHHKKFNKWLVPGGHVEFGESLYDALLREVREEVGIDLAPYISKPVVSEDGLAKFLPLPRFLLEEVIDAHGDDPAHVHLDHVYVIQIPFMDVVHASDELHAMRWCTYQETLALDTFADIRESLKELMTK